MNREECFVCEGHFAYDEAIIEYKNKKYCEDCYEEIKND